MLRAALVLWGVDRTQKCSQAPWRRWRVAEPRVWRPTQGFPYKRQGIMAQKPQHKQPNRAPHGGRGRGGAVQGQGMFLKIRGEDYQDLKCLREQVTSLRCPSEHSKESWGRSSHLTADTWEDLENPEVSLGVPGLSSTSAKAGGPLVSPLHIPICHFETCVWQSGAQNTFLKIHLIQSLRYY